MRWADVASLGVSAAAMFDSMLDSMSTSTMDMAKECLNQVEPGGRDGSAAAASETLDGIEALANAIDSGTSLGESRSVTGPADGLQQPVDRRAAEQCQRCHFSC